MKINKSFIIIISVLNIITISTLKLQSMTQQPQFVQEVHPVQAQLTQVVTMDPTITTVAPQAPLRHESNSVDFSNSNTSTQPNITPYTKNAIIAQPTVVVQRTT